MTLFSSQLGFCSHLFLPPALRLSLDANCTQKIKGLAIIQKGMVSDSNQSKAGGMEGLGTWK